MNLFAYHPDPWQSALWLDDLRKNKMILEAAQMLSTAVIINGKPKGMTTYKATHVSHPCTIWTGLSRGNFNWTLTWMEALVKQKGSYHKSSELLPAFRLFRDTGSFPKEKQTQFANCARNVTLGVDFKHLPVHEAYRNYSSFRWANDKSPPTWLNGERPDWYNP